MRKILFSFVFILLLARNVLACDCVEPLGVDKDKELYDVVFVGKVTSITKVPPNNADEIDMEIKITEFDVVELFKGTTIDKIVTEIITVCCMCGYIFEEGKEYLVYANRNAEGEKYNTSICSRTKLLEETEREELEILRMKETKAEIRNSKISEEE